jgi:hypothetical protein
MDINKEVKKVQEILRIPVSDLEFQSNNSVLIYSDDEAIGGIPCYIISGIYSYDVSANVVNWLEWGKVFNNNADVIETMILQDMGRHNIICQSQLFRQIRVSEYNADNKLIGHQLALYQCAFENNAWTVQRLN